jgi:hypothetical protein
LARRRTSWSSVKKSTASLWRAPLMRLASSKEGTAGSEKCWSFFGSWNNLTLTYTHLVWSWFKDFKGKIT